MPEIISRKEARERGLKRYFTGKACVHGHICERRSHNSGCVECEKKYKDSDRSRARVAANMRRRYWKNPEKFRERARVRGSDVRKKYASRIKKWRDERGKELQREYRRKNREKLNALRRALRARNIEKFRQNKRAEYWRNKEKWLARNKRWWGEGPKNPIGEMQWLRKNQALLRKLKRILKNLKAGRPNGLGEAFPT